MQPRMGSLRGRLHPAAIRWRRNFARAVPDGHTICAQSVDRWPQPDISQTSLRPFQDSAGHASINNQRLVAGHARANSIAGFARLRAKPGTLNRATRPATIPISPDPVGDCGKPASTHSLQAPPS